MENMTNIIPTNVMSMTDGHILFLSSLHTAGKYPAVDPSKSVTRVGKQTMMFIHKVVADKTMALLSEYNELERFSRFGSDLAAETQKTLKRGKVMQELLSQPMGMFVEAGFQILFLGLVFAGFFDEREFTFVHEKKVAILNSLLNSSTFKTMAGKIKDYKFDDLIVEIGKVMGELEKEFPPSAKASEGQAPTVKASEGQAPTVKASEGPPSAKASEGQAKPVITAPPSPEVATPAQVPTAVPAPVQPVVEGPPAPIEPKKSVLGNWFGKK
jgi:hypothetical protein